MEEELYRCAEDAEEVMKTEEIESVLEYILKLIPKNQPHHWFSHQRPFLWIIYGYRYTICMKMRGCCGHTFIETCLTLLGGLGSVQKEE